MKTTNRCLNFVGFILMLMAVATASAAARPDLVVSSTINKTASVAPGGTVTVVSTVKNIGKAKAGKSTTRFYLSKDTVKSAGDIRLTGSMKVPALGRGKSRKATTKLKVPANCPAGRYYLIAAADDRKKVKESREKNNTRKATTKVKVKVKVGTQVPRDFALIPAGTFQMGDPSINERPVHTVFVSAFYMGIYEVTKEEWDAVRAWGSTNGYTDLPVGGGKGANHPVHSITWYDMVKWCNARSEKENLTPCYKVSGATYKTGQNSAVVCDWGANGNRLPTEAEWEKAARGGVSGKLFPWGTDTISQSQANYMVYSSNGTTNHYSYDVTPRPPATDTEFYHPSYTAGGVPYSSPVGSFAPNGYGLYDMAGNMREWCWDWYGFYAAGSQTDPRGSDTGTSRVIRGGGWSNFARFARCADFSDSKPTGNYLNGGFRVARGQP